MSPNQGECSGSSLHGAAMDAESSVSVAVKKAENPLHGTVLDAETNQPIAFVTVFLDGGKLWVTGGEGLFDFGAVSKGSHTLTFDHISYERRIIKIRWPSQRAPLVVKLAPSQFVMDEIVVEGERVIPSLPVSASSFRREEITLAPGNIANDPLRMVQSQPSCASAGVDFLSKMAVRGGDSEEHQVYFDGYPLKHYMHVGGFSGLVYDDMLESMVLVPGAAPIQYHGSLSGMILLKAASVDTSFRSMRYDITSMAGGINQIVSPSLSLQLSAKTSFFNLPVYQQPHVEERSFRDLLGRMNYSTGKSVSINSTILMAADKEIGSTVGSVQPEREVSSILTGVELDYNPSHWKIKVRPSYSLFNSHDAVSWRQEKRDHRLEEVLLHAELSRQGTIAGVGLYGDMGTVHHSGNGGTYRDNPFSVAMDLRLMYKDAASLMIGGGGSREPWVSRFEPEAYGSVWFYLGNIATISAGYRRSHQSPFLFNERRYFASIPTDAGDLLSHYETSWKDAPAVRMDQSSVSAKVNLPLRCSVEYDAFHRKYKNLLTWQWESFPHFRNVSSEGDGHGYGYEIVFRRNDPGFLSLMAAVSRARVWKREGTLSEERIGDFDRPFSWQVGLSVKVFHGVRLSLRWLNEKGRPYTEYHNSSDPPPTGEINSIRLPDFQRLDVKISYQFLKRPVLCEGFLDVINLLDNYNGVMMYAVEVSPGTFVSAPYVGTRFFPIAGVTLRW
jgi:hypothetical protein